MAVTRSEPDEAPIRVCLVNRPERGPVHPIARIERTVAALVMMLQLGLLTACGSTVVPAAGGDESASGAQSGLVDGGTSGSWAGSTAQPGTTVGRSAAQNVGGGVGTYGTDPFTAGVASTRLGKAAPVHVGVFLAGNAEAFYTAVGATNPSGTPDAVAQTRAIINYLNTRGGLGGRRIEPVFAFDDLTSSQTHATQGQAACEKFTTDHHAIAVVSLYVTTDAMNTCLAARSVMNVVMGHYSYPASDFARYSWVSPSTMNADRHAGIYVDQLVKQDYFARQKSEPPTVPIKIGLLYFDTPQIDSVRLKSLNPALARHGLELTDAAGVSYPGSTAEIASSVTQVKSAMLRFRTDGINRVILLDVSGGLYFVAAVVAEDQRYYPRWGLSTMDNPGSLHESGTVPASQSVGAVGVGFSPWGDVNTRHHPPPTSSAKLCDKILVAAGQSTMSGSGWDICDSLFLLHAATRGISSASLVSAKLAGPAILRGVEGLGSSFVPAYTFASLFSRERHDGPSVVRRFGFVDSCECFAYTSGPIPTG